MSSIYDDMRTIGRQVSGIYSAMKDDEIDKEEIESRLEIIDEIVKEYAE